MVDLDDDDDRCYSVRATVTGGIILAPEGINGSICCIRKSVEQVHDFIHSNDRLKGLREEDIHHGHTSSSPLAAGEDAPFRWDHVRVKLKKEIVSLGMLSVSPHERVGTYVSPNEQMMNQRRKMSWWWCRFISLLIFLTIKEGFDLIGTNNEGKINIAELKSGLQRLGHQIPDADLQILKEAGEVDKDGFLNYGEIVVISVQLRKMRNDDHLKDAFDFFDKNQSGYIEIDELREALADEANSEEVISAIIHDVDTDKDGKISFDNRATAVAAVLADQWFGQQLQQQLQIPQRIEAAARCQYIMQIANALFFNPSLTYNIWQKLGVALEIFNLYYILNNCYYLIYLLNALAQVLLWPRGVHVLA